MHSENVVFNFLNGRISDLGSKFVYIYLILKLNTKLHATHIADVWYDFCLDKETLDKTEQSGNKGALLCTENRYFEICHLKWNSILASLVHTSFSMPWELENILLLFNELSEHCDCIVPIHSDHKKIHKSGWKCQNMLPVIPTLIEGNRMLKSKL